MDVAYYGAIFYYGEVAINFIENAKFVGASNENNILNYKRELLKAGDKNVEYAEVIAEQKFSENKPKDELVPDDEKPPVVLPPKPEIPNNHGTHHQQKQLPFFIDSSDYENIKIPLSERKVSYLAYPTGIKKIDIEILKKQLDLLEL